MCRDCKKTERWRCALDTCASLRLLPLPAFTKFPGAVGDRCSSVAGQNPFPQPSFSVSQTQYGRRKKPYSLRRCAARPDHQRMVERKWAKSWFRKRRPNHLNHQLQSCRKALSLGTRLLLESVEKNHFQEVGRDRGPDSMWMIALQCRRHYSRKCSWSEKNWSADRVASRGASCRQDMKTRFDCPKHKGAAGGPRFAPIERPDSAGDKWVRLASRDIR